MRELWDLGVRSEDQQLLLRPETGETVDSQEDDRSLARVMREIGWSLTVWLGFVVAVQLLLHAFRFV
jgi:hypothetical protein